MQLIVPVIMQASGMPGQPVYNSGAMAAFALIWKLVREGRLSKIKQPLVYFRAACMLYAKSPVVNRV